MVGRGRLLVVNITVGDSGSATCEVAPLHSHFFSFASVSFLSFSFSLILFLFLFFIFWNATAYFAPFAIRGYAPVVRVFCSARGSLISLPASFFIALRWLTRTSKCTTEKCLGCSRITVFTTTLGICSQTTNHLRKCSCREYMKYPVRGPSPIAVHGPIAVHSAIFSHLFWTVYFTTQWSTITGPSPYSGPRSYNGPRNMK